MKPFSYPSEKHVRRFEPPPQAQYGNYRQTLEAEFNSQCVYCRLPNGLGGMFTVDHYRPQSLFPERIAEYRNLFYACHACNTRKGDYWPSPARRSAGSFVPNPCQHVMSKHVKYKGAEVIPLTITGSFFNELLLLDDELSVRFREFILREITRAEDDLKASRRALFLLGKRSRREKDPALRAEFASLRTELEDRIVIIKRDLTRLGAGD
jgi:hypothetical protein